MIKLDDYGHHDFVEKPKIRFEFGYYWNLLFQICKKLMNEINYIMDNDYKTRWKYQLTTALENLHKRRF